MPSQAVPSRKDVFRSFLQRFNPTTDPESALRDDLIESSLASGRIQKLRAAVVLIPGSQHLLVGGIGSGKSTDLRLLLTDFQCHEDGLLPILVDVTKYADLRGSGSGAIILSAATALREKLDHLVIKKDILTVLRHLERTAFGYGDWRPDYEYDEPSDEELAGLKFHRIPGIIKPPAEPIDKIVSDIAEQFKIVSDWLRSEGKEVTLLLDGMDRLLDSAQFWSFVDQDFAALRKLGVSLVAAAPLSLLYAEGRSILDHFDSYQTIPAISLDSVGLETLYSILLRRHANELIPTDLFEMISKGSGGVLRDLVSIVQSAAQHAYLESQDEIRAKNIETAITQLGYGYKLGLGSRQLFKLRQLQKGLGFEISSPSDINLIVSRRVLPRKDRYEVHPALLGVLDAAE